MADPFNAPAPPPAPDHRLRPVTPVLARRNEYVPAVGSFLDVMLPGENVRTRVEEAHGRDVIAVQRAHNGLSEIWEPVSRRDVEMREEAARLAEAAAAETAPPEPERKP